MHVISCPSKFIEKAKNLSQDHLEAVSHVFVHAWLYDPQPSSQRIN